MVEAAQALESLRGEEEQKRQPLFIKRVQAIPLVNSALEIYGRSRESSKLLRVGSNVIESGVRRMCEPITKRIDVSQLDNFACRQLDNLGYTMEQHSQAEQYNGADNCQPNAQSTAITTTANIRKRTKDQADRPQSPSQANSWISMHRSSSSTTTTTTTSASTSPYTNGKNRDVANIRDGGSSQHEAAPSSTGGRGWIVGNFVASAKERAIAYREDSMRRLKYCLDWVVYSAALISQHMRDLRALLASLQEAAHIALSGDAANSNNYNVNDAMVHRDPQQQRWRRQHELALRLAKARREIVSAVRKAVGVVSNYAGSVLPGEARRQVRNLILGMPGRWMAVDTAMSQSGGSGSGGTPSVVSETNSGPSSPALVGADLAPANIEATTRRTLAFASESFQMLNSISGVFGHLYANAERWVGSTATADSATADSAAADQALPPTDSFATYRDRNGNDADSSSDRARLPPSVRRPQRRLPLNLTPMGGEGKGRVAAAAGYSSEDVAAANTAAEAISRLSTMPSYGETSEMQAKRRSLQQQPLFGGGGGSAATRPASASSASTHAMISPLLRASGAAPAATTATAFRYSVVAASSADDDAADWVAHKRNRTREPTPTRM
ncbi:transcriptional regulator opi1 [Coemansia erecta]|nr:transcriptional regulator opi1 [Coemansia erecta]